MSKPHSIYRDFIRAKFDLIADEIEHEPTREHFRNLFEGEVEDMPHDERSEIKRARDLDRTFERLLTGLYRLPIRAGRTALRARFGFDRLSHEPSLLVPRVLKRGKIINDAEAQEVRMFVADQRNREKFGDESYVRLAEILDEAGY